MYKGNIQLELGRPWLIHTGAADLLSNPELLGFGEQNECNVSFASCGSPLSVDSSLQTGGSSVIINISGVITNQNYGGLGMYELDRQLRLLDHNDMVSSFEFIFDTPGGQASYMHTVASTIASLSKPTTAYIKTICASAGYYLACACDKVYLNQVTDKVGSVGGKVVYIKPSKEDREKVAVVRSDYSPLKSKQNQDFLEGDFESFDSSLMDGLNSITKLFIDFVKQQRPQISDKEVFQGEMYSGKQALEVGLIDGFKSFESVLTARYTKAINNKTNIKMSETTQYIGAVCNALGFEGIEFNEGHASLSKEHLEVLGAAIIDAQANKQTQQQEPSVSKSSFDSLTATVTQLQDQLKTVGSVVESISEMSSAKPALTEKPSDDEPDSGWALKNCPFETYKNAKLSNQ